MFTIHGQLGWTISGVLGTRPAAILHWLERQAAGRRGGDPLRGLPSHIRGDIGLSERAEGAAPERAQPGRALRDLPSSTWPGR